MSYDLMVFEPTAAPREREDFMRWYEKQTTWSEGHGYDDYHVCSPALQRWFREMITFFPAMKGSLASKEHHSLVTDHCCGRSVIYSAFAWSVAESARIKTRELAIKHHVGFFEVSADRGEILFPDNPPASNQRLERP